MRDAVEDLRRTVEEAAARLLSMSEAESEARAAGGAWSAKETLGHLVDSAANNHRRFVLARLGGGFVFEGYDQDGWVGAQQYQRASWPQLVALWRLYNLHLCHVIGCAEEEELRRPRHPHSLDRIAWRRVAAAEPATLEYLFRDYVGHLKHHLAQIAAGVPAPRET
jgi:uncharacterized damage-inducible protein DinB